MYIYPYIDVFFDIVYIYTQYYIYIIKDKAKDKSKMTAM